MWIGEWLVERHRQTHKRSKKLPGVLRWPAVCEASCQAHVKPSHVQKKATHESEKAYTVYQLTEVILGDVVESSLALPSHSSLFVSFLSLMVQ